MSHCGPSRPSETIDEIYYMHPPGSETDANPGSLVANFKKTVMLAQAQNVVKSLNREELKELEAKFPGFMLDLTDGLREMMAAD